MTKRCDPLERDCLYNLISEVSQDVDNNLQVLGFMEGFYSRDLSGSIPRH